MTTHTPGPWEVLNETEVFTGLGADSGDGVKALPSDGWMIADCGDCVTFTEIGPAELGRDLRKANARLIAAAPDLLEALEGVERLCSQSGYIGVNGQYLKVVRAAIAKARVKP
ncbi:hypothetical protein [Pseudomonas sp. EZ-C24]|uniref:hypothetical protein n=1 Tax=Pseudomonas sp. EZ-C24 TaxID=2753617 RepID=UPI00165DC4B8|nr:hypothetical protein [Pseudomonas sp. EZ-C24]